jgi:hypothetical protein
MQKCGADDLTDIDVRAPGLAKPVTKAGFYE